MRRQDAIYYLIEKVNPQEPVFILRGGDDLAVATIFYWVDSAKIQRVSQPKIESAIETVGEFLRYEGPKKLPD